MSLFLAALLAAGLYTFRAMAEVKCPPWQVDNFQLADIKQNNLGYLATDDNSMWNLTVHRHRGTITFNTRPECYWYEQLPCTNILENEFEYISYMIRGPPHPASVMLQIYSHHSCNTAHEEVKSYFIHDTNFDGEIHKRQIPLEFFSDMGADLRAVTGIKWSTFRDDQDQDQFFEWELGNIQITCKEDTSKQSEAN